MNFENLTSAEKRVRSVVGWLIVVAAAAFMVAAWLLHPAAGIATGGLLALLLALGLLYVLGDAVEKRRRPEKGTNRRDAT